MEIPSDKELLATDKAGLDKLKVALEISGFKEKQKSDRVRYRQETLRLFIIAVFSGIITFGSTYFQKSTERRLKKIDDQETKLQELVLDLEDNSISQQAKYGIICKISRLKVPTDADTSFINSVADYEKKCEESRKFADQIDKKSAAAQNNSKTIDTTRTDVKARLAALDQSDQQEARLQNDAYAKTATGQKAALTISKQADSLLKSAPSSLQAASDASAGISGIVKQRIDLVPDKPAESAATFYRVQWFKKGYAIQVGHIYFTLLDLDRRQQTIRVKACYTNTPFSCEHPLETSGELDIRTPLLFSYGDKQYELSLKSINHAGKNPFTLAAYVALKESQK
ncbi:hypothetical protein ACFGVS_00735 [Mucilaginibacter sp. AW1-7]|uniref:hypothetical protein n=1 Tax=Mucilaginibacter sp. AW1-7 TaxID=3349874 RepID=UPI003F73C1ED